MRRKSFWTLGLVACLALAIASFADHKPGHKKPGGGGGGGSKLIFDVAFENGDPPIPPYQAPTYLPPCLAHTGGKNNYSALFPRHDLCATVTTSTGYQLTDDIGVTVNTTKGLITSVQLRGQDVIGEDGIAHESELVALTPPVAPSDAGFTLHVHVDNLPIWKLSRHLGGKRVEIVGYISLADMVYTPQP